MATIIYMKEYIYDNSQQGPCHPSLVFLVAAFLCRHHVHMYTEPSLRFQNMYGIHGNYGVWLDE
jgi:hypothetical protein